MDYRKQLLFGGKRIGIWGTGYIGFSTMAHYAAEDVMCLGVDTNLDRVRAINAGEIYIPGLTYWLGFETRPLVTAGLLSATADYRALLQPDVLVHFVCVPTEKDGRPFADHLIDVVGKIAQCKRDGDELPPLLIIESTLTPGTSDKVVLPLFRAGGLTPGEDILYVVAPRRDWFVDRDKSLRALDRVFGGINDRATDAARDVLGLVCDRLHAASDHRTAEMVKSIENAYRHMEITLANQLSLAYPHVNIREVLQLVGTKWNVGTFQPSFGTGGYCIPLSSRYVLEGAERPEHLSILAETVKTDGAMPARVAASLLGRRCKTVGILGLSYKGNLKVPALSPSIGIVQALVAGGAIVKLYDPYFTAQEVREIAGVETFAFPEGLRDFDAIVVTADHKEFMAAHVHSTLTSLARCKVILDNVGIWRDLALHHNHIEYHLAGDAHWLDGAS